MKSVLAILSIIPSIIEVIKMVEELLPESGKGAQKLALVKDIIGAVYEDIMDSWESIEKVVGVIVSWLNAMGIFKKD